MDLAILAAVFLAARSLAIFAVLSRGTALVRSDGHNYISIAESLLSEGVLPLDNRQFPGFGILIAMVSSITWTDPVVAGMLLVFLPGIGVVWLFHILTRNFALSLLLIFVLPGWASTGIMAEGLTMFCLLCVLIAFGREVEQPRGALLALVGGLMVVANPPMLLAIAPLGAVAAWSALVGGRRDLLLRGILFMLPFALYAVWAQLTMGTIRPESGEQLRYTIEQARGYYPERLLTWPGHSLVLGILNPAESPLKQASVLFTIGLGILGAIGLLMRGRETTRLGGTGTLLGLGVILYIVFHLSVGGPWGFNTTERYLGKLSPLILLGIFGDRRPHWWVLLCAMAGSLAYTSLAGRQM